MLFGDENFFEIVEKMCMNGATDSGARRRLNALQGSVVNL